MLKQNHVKLMLGEGEMLDHEFLNLGDTFPHYLYPHLRLMLEEQLVGGSVLNGRVLLISTQ